MENSPTENLKLVYDKSQLPVYEQRYGQKLSPLQAAIVDNWRKAALGYWKILVEKGDYTEARKIFKGRKLSTSMVTPLIKEIYNHLTAEGKKDEAAELANEYNVSVGFWDWIKGMFGG